MPLWEQIKSFKGIFDDYSWVSFRDFFLALDILQLQRASFSHELMNFVLCLQSVCHLLRRLAGLPRGTLLSWLLRFHSKYLGVMSSLCDKPQMGQFVTLKAKVQNVFVNLFCKFYRLQNWSSQTHVFCKKYF